MTPSRCTAICAARASSASSTGARSCSRAMRYTATDAATTESATAAAEPTAILARKLTSGLAKGVSDATNGVDEPRRAALLRLSTQIPDVDVQRVGRRSEVVAPHALEDDRPRQHLARIAEEELEQRKLCTGEVDRRVSASHLTRPEVELEIRETQDVRRFAVARPSKQGAQASQELSQGKGLRKVVVRPRIEAGDAAVDLGARGEHENGNGVVLGAEAPTHFEPVDPRHEHVEDHRVGRRGAGDLLERPLPVLGELDLVALELERSPERLAHGSFVVDYEDLHRRRIVRIATSRQPRVLATS